jgi:flagellar biosynthetic protein FlhB
LAESNGQEKTEQPTSKRRSDARKDGNVLQSREISTVVMLIGVFWVARIMMPHIYVTLRDYMKLLLGGAGQSQASLLTYQLFMLSVVSFAKCALPLLLVAMVCGIVAGGTQTKFNVTFKVLRPKFSKLNPIKGIKNLFSLKKIVDLVKNLIKICILLVILYNIIKDDLEAIARTIDMMPFNSAILMLNMMFSLVVKVCIAFVVIAFLDYLYQRWDYERNLKMTKQEVKDEYKQTEGNPEIKGRIRRIQRQMAMSRMMQKVPQADVVVKNPTHFAVALKYDPDHYGAPVVLAKGQDSLALRIIKKAEESGVYVLENRPLARALYASCQLDREIPAEYYGAVAEILVYIYKATNREDMFNR